MSVRKRRPRRSTTQWLVRSFLFGAALAQASSLQAAQQPTEDAVRALEQQLARTAGAEAVRIATEQFGQIALAARAQAAEPATARALAAAGRRLLGEAHRRQGLAEAQVGNDEAGLAHLYSSPAWADLSYAYDWLPCWIGWLQLIGLAPSGDERGAQIKEARQALQRGLLIVSRPELVAQSARGLARIALLEKRPVQALEVLKSLHAGFAAQLQAATLADLDEQIQAIGAVQAPRPAAVPVAGSGTSAAAAARMDGQLERIRALLDQQTRLGVGAAEAAPLIQDLLQAGAWDERLVQAALHAHGALADQEVGVIGDLLVAEDLLENQRFYSASEKYTQFFRLVTDAPARGLSRWRYRHGYACLKAGLTECALDVVDDLRTRWSLSPELDAACRKLRFFALYERNRSVASENNTRKLASAAEEMIRADPADPDADWARLALADFAPDSSEADRQLAQIRDPKHLEGAVEVLKYRRVVEALLADAPAQDAEALKPMADRAGAALEAVSDAQRDEPWIKTSALLVRILRTRADPKLQARLAEAVDAPDSERLTWQAGYWALLRIWVAQSDRAELGAEAARTAASAFDEWRLALLLGALEEFNDPGLSSAATAQLAGEDVPLPWRVHALVSRGTAQLRLGQAQQAYETARRALALDPQALDANWLFAATCDASRRSEEAEAAWQRLRGERSAAAGARTTLWMLETAALARREREGCALARSLGREAQSLSPAHRARAREAAESLGCVA
jgi:hypothetical protein